MKIKIIDLGAPLYRHQGFDKLTIYAYIYFSSAEDSQSVLQYYSEHFASEGGFRYENSFGYVSTVILKRYTGRNYKIQFVDDSMKTVSTGLGEETIHSINQLVKEKERIDYEKELLVRQIENLKVLLDIPTEKNIG